MPIALDTDLSNALEYGAVVDRGMILLDLGSGLVGFWTGAGPFEYNGVIYTGASDIIHVEDVAQNSSLSATQVAVSVSSIPNSDLTPGVLAQFEAEVYHRRQVSLMTAYFDINTGALLSVTVDYRGYIDKAPHQRGEQATLTLILESRFREHQRKGYRVRSDIDQRRISATDDMLKDTAVVGTQRILFGRTAERAPRAQQKKKGFFARLFG